MDSYNSPTTKPLFRGIQIIWYVLGVVETLLAFRFLLKLLSASPVAGFTSFVYSITLPLVQPFISVFERVVVSGAVFEWTTVLAMVVYWIIAMGIVRLFLMSRTVSTPEAAANLDTQETI